MSNADAPSSGFKPTSAERGEEAGRLLSRIGEGDIAAFKELYTRTSAKLLGTCMRILSERGEAEEAVQEAYLSIWRRAASFDPARGSAMAWLLTVSRNCAVDRLRARTKVASTPLEQADEVPDQAPLAWQVMERAQEDQRVIDCIEMLDRRDATLIRAAFYQGSSYPELADRAALPLGTIKSRIRRALIKLADCLR